MTTTEQDTMRMERDLERLRWDAGDTWAALATVGEILGVPDSTPNHAHEVEKAVRALQARVEELEAALRPFACMDSVLKGRPDSDILWYGADQRGKMRDITAGEIRAAAAAQAGEETR